MIPSSTDYKLSVFAPSRQVNARATITMSAFSQLSPVVKVLTPSNYKGKVTNSLTVNSNIAKRTSGGVGGGSTTLLAPSAFPIEFAQSWYDNLSVDGSWDLLSATTNGAYSLQLFSLDVIKYLENMYGKNIWQKRNVTLSEKIAKAKNLITNIDFNHWGYGSGPNGNAISLTVWNGAWNSTVSHFLGTPTKLTRSTNPSGNVIMSDGYVHFMAYSPTASNGTVANSVITDKAEFVVTVTQTTTRTFEDDRIVSANVLEEVSTVNETSPANQLLLTLDNTDNLFNFIGLNNIQTIIASRPKIDLEFGLVLSDGVTIEWVTMGTYYVDNWKNNVGNLTITFTAHDLLYILGNTSFPSQAIGNLGTTVQSIMTLASITDYTYDTSLNSLTGNNRVVNSTNCREMLQNIGITSGLTLYQDRYGQLRLDKFQDLAQSTSYITYATTQNALGSSGYVSPSTFSVQDTDGGMRAIMLDQMYQIPEIALDKSVYQISVNVYNTNPSIEDITQVIYTNPDIQGNAGESFTIDIPLIQSTAVAKAVADRFFTESAYNAVYVSRWRQNPVLMATDVIVISDSENSAKVTRVTKQEFQYQGFLTGTTESRGGI